jgi:hypothetical protein
MPTEVTRGGMSGADRVLQRLARRHDLAAVIVTAMAANVMRPLELATVAALRVSLLRQSLMAASHSSA